MSLKSETIATYNTHAEKFAEKFNKSGTRKTDIDFVFSFCNKENPIVLEIGCGNGRDAQEISKHTDRYLGIDASSELIAIAKRSLPDNHFAIANVEYFTFPTVVDITFAFASLIHLSKKEIINIFKKIEDVTPSGGLCFISCKYAPTYEQLTKKDDLGVRTYWHYSETDISGFTKKFAILNTKIQTVHNQEWIDVLFQKI